MEWNNIFDALHRSWCRLEKLTVTGNGVHNRTALWLSDALLNHRNTLKILDLWKNSGWRDILPLVQEPTSVLEEIHLIDNSITNEGMNYITNLLTNNSMLQKLEPSGNHEITAPGWVAF